MPTIFKVALLPTSPTLPNLPQDMSSFATMWYQFITHHEYGVIALQLGVMLVLALFLHLVKNLVSNVLLTRLSRTGSFWDDALVYAAKLPLSFLIWLAVAIFAVETLHENALISNTVYISWEIIYTLALVFIFALFVWRFINAVESNAIASKKRKVDITTIQASAKFTRIALFMVIALLAFQSMNYSIGGLLALGGAGSLVMGLAAKDLLANFFGGITIYLDRPFAVGDWIRTADPFIEGHVERIGWRSTRIRTFEKRPLYVPNSVFTTVALENPSRMLNRRIKEPIGLRYEDASKLARIIAAIQVMLKNHPDIDQQQTCMLSFTAFGQSSLDLVLYCFTAATDTVEYANVKQDILLKIVDIVSSYGADFAFPTRVIYTKSLTEHV